jgi:hypothetical protein
LNFLRGIAGVAIGFAFFVVAVRMVSPSDGLMLNATCTIAAALASGFLAALIAGSHEFPWAATVGLLMIGSGFLSMRQQGLPRPGWYEMTIAGCGPVSALLGAAIWLLAKLKMKRPRDLSPGGNRSPQ